MDCIHTDAPQRPETMALVADRLEIAAKQHARREQNNANGVGAANPASGADEGKQRNAS